MINCIVIYKSEEILAESKKLIISYQNGNPAFIKKSFIWFDLAEKTLSELKIPEGSEINSLKSNIMKMYDKLKTNDKSVKRSDIRHATNTATVDAIERIEEIFRNRVLEAEDTLKHFEEKLCEGMTAFLLQNEITRTVETYNSWLEKIWNSLCQQQATKPLSLYIKASLTSYDRYYILDNIMRKVLDGGLREYKK